MPSPVWPHAMCTWDSRLEVLTALCLSQSKMRGYIRGWNKGVCHNRKARCQVQHILLVAVAVHRSSRKQKREHRKEHKSLENS